MTLENVQVFLQGFSCGDSHWVKPKLCLNSLTCLLFSALYIRQCVRQALPFVYVIFWLVLIFCCILSL